MTLNHAHAFQLANFSESDVEDILADLDYLLQNSTWPYSRERTAEMVVDSPDLLIDFLRSVRPDALRSALIPRPVKARFA